MSAWGLAGLLSFPCCCSLCLDALPSLTSTLHTLSNLEGPPERLSWVFLSCARHNSWPHVLRFSCFVFERHTPQSSSTNVVCAGAVTEPEESSGEGAGRVPGAGAAAEAAPGGRDAASGPAQPRRPPRNYTRRYCPAVVKFSSDRWFGASLLFRLTDSRRLLVSGARSVLVLIGVLV